MEDNLFDSTSNQLTKIDGIETLSQWSDDKKKEFVSLFDKRSNVARFLLKGTAIHLLHKAKERHFISQKHYDKLQHKYRQMYPDGGAGEVGGRAKADLYAIAKERADTILAELPPLKSIVEVIDADLAKQIVRRDKLKKMGQELAEKLGDLSEPIDMAELDQSITIGQFRAEVKDLEKKRKKVYADLEEVGKEGAELESIINKKLYSGLPGLTDAIISTIDQHMEQRTALDEMSRRVSERVMFGDSEAAMDILKHFEKDEVAISDDIKANFTAALEKLKLHAGGKKVKAKRALKEAVDIPKYKDK